MIKWIIGAIIGLVALVGYGQSTYKGSVFNKENRSLSGVEIISIVDATNGVVSDTHGNFEIEIPPHTEVIISHIGYRSIEIELANKHNVIFLEEETQSLNEIVISASRERQKRSEIPASVSIINQDLIKKTKAIGIEQLVNQAPGVFMSTSSVSGNEQHMMAVRSPITTNALFLYLEDGIPIRPSAIFNHNALLETNQTAFDRVEILKGPASSIYGSDAIGGSFNFITKTPSPEFNSSLGFEINDLGFKRYELELSKYTNDNFGLYIGGHYAERNNGPIGHSDYEKFGITFKGIYHISASTSWENVFDLIDYRSDTTGDLSTEDYSSKKFESDQTFTNREARSFRYRSTLNKTWSLKNKTSFNFLFRDNILSQIPDYRITQFRDQDQLTGAGTGEVNSNQFNSVMGLIQHKIKFNAYKSSLIFGVSIDFTQQDYLANTANVDVNVQTGQNIAYTVNANDFILNYKAKITNYAGYLQYEISPLKKLKLTTAIRFDKFQYNYDNLIESVAGAKDAKSSYGHVAPKIGANYDFSNVLGIYANYSNGFTPPQASDLYRNGFSEVGSKIFNLKPSTYHNFELGSYFQPNQKLQMAISLYILNGKNTLVSLRDENDVYYNTNIGSTRSTGVEYNFNYQINQELSISHNGSYASHRYIDFFDRGIDYSHTNMVTAPKLLGRSMISYSPDYFKGFSISMEQEIVGKYNTSFEGQVVSTHGSISTGKYPGHNIFNLRVLYRNPKIEIWAHLLNIFDSLYATRVIYNQFREENTYTVGNPQTFHLGVKYHF